MKLNKYLTATIVLFVGVGLFWFFILNKNENRVNNSKQTSLEEISTPISSPLSSQVILGNTVNILESTPLNEEVINSEITIPLPESLVLDTTFLDATTSLIQLETPQVFEVKL